ncbi:MAG: 5'-methylthioadenosine/adenosylhomocysteine nucleosidase [Treponema sp.]|nr:5'-methylthioadenosine/adenosylhomocysteine nucleosidase [Treponema sp.]
MEGGKYVKFGIIGAMEIEVQTLVSRMTSESGSGVPKLIHAASLDFYDGMLHGVPAVVVKSGIGKVNAALCAERLVHDFGATHVINTGIAGAMASGLGVFDIVISTDALYHDVDVTGFGYEPTVIPQMMESCFRADDMLIHVAEKAFEKTAAAKNHMVIKGRVASGDQFISSATAKKRIQEVCNPACVEMEGAAIAHACYLNGIPFVIIRAMSDMADDGEETSYKFNDTEAAEESAAIVIEMCRELAGKA